MSTFNATAIRQQLNEMACKTQVVKTYQQALGLWQDENYSLTEAQAYAVMSPDMVDSDPFGDDLPSLPDLFARADEIMSSPLYS